MATFTFITDYQGGTYISQQKADDLLSACYCWRDHVLSGNYIQNLEPDQFASTFNTDIEELPPVAIDDVINVWLFQLFISGSILNLHIILTSLSASNGDGGKI